MSDKMNKGELDELSLLLDEMNAGRKPECEDRELAELLAVAEFIKNTGGPICPPRHILDQTVDRALAGIEAGKPKPSRSWWFSGAMGTAAAVLLVIGLNMLPSSKERVPIVPPPPVISQEMEVSQAKADTEKQPAAPQAAPADTSPAPVQPAPAAEQHKATPKVAQAPPTESPKPPTTAREKAIMTEEGPRISQSKSAYIPEASKPPDPSLAPLKLLGKVPDLVVTDRENGFLRQVFFKGTPQEVTITQRLQSKAIESAQAKSQYPSAPLAPGYSPDAISVQVTIAGQEVTIEGRQSRQELLKLAESLTP